MLLKNLKWISTGFVLTGIFLTNLNIYPINIFFHGLGVLGWTYKFRYTIKDNRNFSKFWLTDTIIFNWLYKFDEVISNFLDLNLKLKYTNFSKH